MELSSKGDGNGYGRTGSWVGNRGVASGRRCQWGTGFSQFQFHFSILFAIVPLRVKGVTPPPGWVPAHAAALPILVEAGYLHVSLHAPIRVMLLQLLQLDRERGSGWVKGGGTTVARYSTIALKQHFNTGDFIQTALSSTACRLMGEVLRQSSVWQSAVNSSRQQICLHLKFKFRGLPWA